MKLITAISILLSANILYANEYIENGQELFTGNDCLKCHSTDKFKARKEKVHNFEKLHKIVNACTIASGTPWFDDEIRDVSSYLNANYYNFKEPKREDD